MRSQKSPLIRKLTKFATTANCSRANRRSCCRWRNGIFFFDETQRRKDAERGDFDQTIFVRAAAYRWRKHLAALATRRLRVSDRRLRAFGRTGGRMAAWRGQKSRRTDFL